MAKDKLGKLLMDAHIITKRQLSEAVEKQTVGGDKELGQILTKMGHVTLDDLTEVMLGEAKEAESEREKSKRDRILQKQIFQKKIDVKPVEPKASTKAKPTEISEEKILGSKFTLSLQTMIAGVMGLSSLIGMWYMLQADIQEAKELPIPLSLFSEEYPSKADGYNWAPSYEQYKQQVGALQEDVDQLFETSDAMQEEIDELNKMVMELRIKVK
tara:strand:- start:1509 stop:2150 length:642 start_codon:yes stop_codon:yes gene_type:complete